jgi:ankyrin repeat protein
VWCGVVWCGVVWCGVVWCGVIVQTLLTRDDIDVNKPRTADGITPLYMASIHGKVEVVRLLLSQPNIDINKLSTRGDSALGMATQYNHTEVVQLLTEAGAQ